jgi:SOS response regulatory protein OraA/RecX
MNLQTLSENKYALLKGPDDYNKKVKIFRFLANKGYEQDLFMGIVNELFKN